MINSAKKISFIIILWILTSVAIQAQVQPSLFQLMGQAFRQLDYATARKLGGQIVADFKKYTPLELLEAHKILGVIAYQDGRVSEAHAQFEQALSIDRTASLDSVYVSPKIIHFFEEVKLQFNAKKASAGSEQFIHYRYLMQPDPRPIATLRSMVMPGWGQLYKHDRTKGYVLIGSSATLILSAVALHLLQRDAHDQYLKAVDEKTIQQKYDRYNLLFKLRNNAALVYGGVWLYSFFDALLTAPKERPIRVSLFMEGYPTAGVQVSF